MAYIVYTTQGVVIGRVVVGESTLLCRLYTKEYGAISIRAQSGARSLKFATALQVGTVGVYDFVHARNGYKLTGIVPINTVNATRYDEHRIRFIRMCCAYLLRFVPGDEEKDNRLYTLIMDAVSFAEKNDWSANWWNSFRFRVLKILGYISDDVPVTDQLAVEKAIAAGESFAQL